MAQYDLLLTQNVHASGVEFSEKYVNIAKGALLSADASGTPTVLAAGTDGYKLVRDDAETTGLKWIPDTAGVDDALVFKGVLDCSTNPNYPAADAGDVYKVSVAGKIGGASGVNVEIGDTLYCTQDSTASGDHATVGQYWAIIQSNLDGAVIGPASATDNYPALFDGSTGKLIKAGTAALGSAAYEASTAFLGSWASAPASKTSSGTAGQVAKDDNFIYVCTATDTWKRAPIATNW
jgi:hypothetical protein